MPELIAAKVIRKLSRLSTMRPWELAHRSREKAYVELDRIGFGIRGGPKPFTVGMPFRQYLLGMPASRFYQGQREDLRPFVEARFPTWIDRATEEAEHLCRHQMTLLGHKPVELGAAIDWHRDPVTGRTWERRFWADYQLVHDNGGRDPKTIHELNRHQHLPRLAKAFILTGNEKYALEAVTQLNSWIDQNPPGLGINWQSSLEIGIRAISWLWTIFPLLSSRAFDAASAERISISLFAQLEHVHRYSSRFSSPNTHLIGEAAALFLAGIVFRDQEQPAVWLRESAAVLAETAEKQVLADGVYGELSSCYHCYALDFYLQAMVLADQNQIALPESLSLKVQGMLQFLMRLTRPDGTLPLLGDDDGGRALALDNKNYRSFLDGLCLGAILYRQGEYKHQAGPFCEESLWMLGKAAVDTFSHLESVQPSTTNALFSSAGYHAQRTGWGALDSHMVFDCGGLGMLTGAHAHADALSVTLFSGGRELLVDPGTFVYNCAPQWRSYFRSTRAHNTVTIDGQDQSEQGGTFCWKTKQRCRIAIGSTLPGVEYVEGEHDGYLRLPQGVIHRRRLLFVPPGSWIVVDDFRGSGEHKFDFRYHFAPDVEVSSVEQDGDSILIRVDQAGLVLQMFADRPVLSAALTRGETAPPGGWTSDGYGHRQPCSVLRATLAGSPPAAAITYLITATTCPEPCPDGLFVPRLRRLKIDGGNGIACSYHHHGFEDITVISTGDAELTVGSFRLHGEFFWLRLEHGDLKQVLAMQACLLDHGGREVFRRSEPGRYWYVN
jgi:hypothetical protein